MRKQRYFIEKKDKSLGVSVMSAMSNSHHYQSITDDLIFGVGILEAEHLNSAWDHSNVFLFPSLHDHRPLSYWVEQQKLTFDIFEALKQFGITPEDTCKEALVKITDHFDHAVFELDS